MKIVRLKSNIVYRGINMHRTHIDKGNDLGGMQIELTEIIPFNLLGLTIELKRKRYFFKPLIKNVYSKQTLNMVGVDGDYANLWMILKSKIKVHSDIEPSEVLTNRSDIVSFLNLLFKFNK